MALINCPICGKPGVSDHAVICPNCGYSIYRYLYSVSGKAESKKEFYAVLYILVLHLIFSLFGLGLMKNGLAFGFVIEVITCVIGAALLSCDPVGGKVWVAYCSVMFSLIFWKAVALKMIIAAIAAVIVRFIFWHRKNNDLDRYCQSVPSCVKK